MIHYPTVVDLIYAQHQREPLRGRVLMIGWQSVTMTVARTYAAMAAAGITPRKVNVYTDRHTKQGKALNWIDAECFFNLLADVEVMALDHSGYEGAKIVHNLNSILPRGLCNTADYIVDGSCLDNLFDPARALRAMSAMLKPGGRLLSYSAGVPIGGAYIVLTADWYRDFLEHNNYAEVDVKNYYFEDVFGAWQKEPPMPHYVVLASARKTAASTSHVSPIQAGYRQESSDAA